MANTWYPASEIIGGTDGALDAIDGSGLVGGDRCLVLTDTLVLFYVLDETSGVAENSPFVIEPDTNPGDKRWILITVVNKNLMFASNSDGSHSPNIIGSINGTNDIILGGTGNEINTSGAGYYNTILGGTTNLIEHEAQRCLILGGLSNKIYRATTCGILGSSNNIGTKRNKVQNSLILGGANNKIQGCSNTFFQYSACVGGNYNSIVDGEGVCILGGSFNESVNNYDSAMVGSNGESYNPAQLVLSGNSNTKSNFPGQHQTLWNILAAETVNASQTECWLRHGYSTSARLVLKTQKMCKFVISVAAMQVGGTAGTVGDSAFWEITGAFKNIGGQAAKGTITTSYFAPGTDTVALLDGSTFNINGTTYTWRETVVDPADVLIPTEFMDMKYNIMNAIRRYPPAGIAKDKISGDDIILESQRHLGDTPNSWTFTEDCSNMTMDGSGSFGGTQAGASGTLSIVGTPQGVGTPDANNRDAGASLWNVDVDVDNYYKYLKVKITGEADKTIRWTAKVSLVEVC